MNILALIVAALTAVGTNTLAFPDAEGYGKYTVGGRGGKVYKVTNLNDAGPGSLREAVEAEGARMVLFDVDGTIELQSPLRIVNDSITIAGQSAPGDGICLKDYPLIIDGSEVIVRYIRVRPGDKINRDNDGLGGGRYGQRNVIVDHCSVSWSIDECLSLYKVENMTVQWCLVSHSLNSSVHTKGSHGFGGIWGGFKATFHHNLLANHSSRNPRFSSVDGTKWVDFRNNAIYNWGFKSGYGGGHHAEINMVNNYYKPGPASEHQRIFDVADDATGRYYIMGNVMEGNDSVTANNHLGVTDSPGKQYFRHRRSAPLSSGISPDAVPELGEVTSSCLVEKPFPYESITEDTPETAYQRILASVGCSFARDSYDTDVIRQVKLGLGENGKNGIIDTPSQVGGWPVLTSGNPKVDSDGDGIPDEWELSHGLDPNDSNDSKMRSKDSHYTNLEVYLESILKN